MLPIIRKHFQAASLSAWAFLMYAEGAGHRAAIPDSTLPQVSSVESYLVGWE